MVSCSLDLALAFFPCSRALHVKGRQLPEIQHTSADIGISSLMSREINELLPEDIEGRRGLGASHVVCRTSTLDLGLCINNKRNFLKIKSINRLII